VIREKFFGVKDLKVEKGEKGWVPVGGWGRLGDWECGCEVGGGFFLVIISGFLGYDIGGKLLQ